MSSRCLPSQIIKRLLGWLVIALFLLASAVALANLWVCQAARGRLAQNILDLPENDVALVLGTAPTIGRWSNPFFVGRITAAAELFNQGKVKHLLVSGDNSRRSYDEPTAMRDALIARGVPETAITRDYAGFRTLDSMARARAVFGLRRVTVVTDEFHQARALFLAKAHGLDAVGFPSAKVPFRWAKKTLLREIGSRVKAWLDVYILRTQPHFYGPVVEVRIAAESRVGGPSDQPE